MFFPWWDVWLLPGIDCTPSGLSVKLIAGMAHKMTSNTCVSLYPSTWLRLFGSFLWQYAIVYTPECIFIVQLVIFHIGSSSLISYALFAWRKYPGEKGWECSLRSAYVSRQSIEQHVHPLMIQIFKCLHIESTNHLFWCNAIAHLLKENPEIGLWVSSSWIVDCGS